MSFRPPKPNEESLRTWRSDVGLRCTSSWRTTESDANETTCDWHSHHLSLWLGKRKQVSLRVMMWLFKIQCYGNYAAYPRKYVIPNKWKNLYSYWSSFIKLLRGDLVFAQLYWDTCHFWISVGTIKSMFFFAFVLSNIIFV